MLHEVLLALSGHPSPILSEENEEQSPGSLLSPSENTLLNSLARLGSLQSDIRDRASTLSNSSSSTICRAVSTSVVAKHLAEFEHKTLEVEQGILQHDARYVGAYDIVPLSGVVGAFAGWHRVLEWLQNLMLFVQAADKKESREVRSGAQIIDWLRKESRTGYPDLERIATSLVAVAESAWLRQLSAWLLYGRLPSLGADDFFIQKNTSDVTGIANYKLISRLCPIFVNSSTANSILFVGRSLNYVHDRGLKLLGKDSGQGLSTQSLLSAHLAQMSSIKHPISVSTLSRIVGTIRSSLAQHVLQVLLPMTAVVQILDVLRSFFLLERGEFAVALVDAADNCLSARHLRSTTDPRHRDAHRLGGVMIREGEVTTVLRKAWASLVAVQNITDNGNDDDTEEDEDLDMARDLVQLSIKKPNTTSTATSTNDTLHFRKIELIFDDVLLGTPTHLTLNTTSPLDLFLAQADIQAYSLTNSYLLSIRRAHLHLSNLWRNSVLRRTHPSPLQASTSQAQPSTIAAAREHKNKHTKRMRATWAIISAAAFFFAQLGAYLQGEVVASSWATFRQWLQQPSSSPVAAPPSAAKNLRTSTESHSNVPAFSPPFQDTTSQTPLSLPVQHHDPELLSLAHRAYLSSLADALLLTDWPFVSSLRALLAHCDHLVALTGRLAVIRQTTEAAEAIEMVSGGLATADRITGEEGRREEEQLMESLRDAGRRVKSGLEGLEKRLKEIGNDGRRDTQGKGGMTVGAIGGDGSGADDYSGAGGKRVNVDEAARETGFVPWSGGGVERLLARLDLVRDA